MKNEVRVAIIGYGFAGRTFHAPIIASVPGLRLVTVVQHSAVVSMDKYPGVNVVSDVQHVYRDDTIDLVIVATPSTNHFEFAKDALLAGKHVVVEKPFTVTFTEANELIQIAKAKGKVLSVFHNRRWDGDFLTVKGVFHEGLLGELKEVQFRWDRYRPVVHQGKAVQKGLGTGVFYDLGVHLLDQAVCLFGVPETIRAEVRRIREEAETDDYVEIVLNYTEGPKVNIVASLLAREHGPRYVMHGTLGSFVKYGEDPQEDMLKSGLTPTSSSWGLEPQNHWGTLNVSVRGMDVIGKVKTLTGRYQDFYQNIYHAICDRDELYVKPEQARALIRLIELGYQSDKERRTIAVTQ